MNKKMSCPHTIMRLSADETSIGAQFEGTLKGDQLDMLATQVRLRHPAQVNLDFSQVVDADVNAVGHVPNLTDAAHDVGAALRVVAAAAAAGDVINQINLLR